MKWSVVGALVLGAVGVLFVPKPAEALPTTMNQIYYYNSAAMTQVVGSRVLTSCGGGPRPLVGQTSQHYTRLSMSCSGDAGTSVSCYSHNNKINCPATICQQVPEFC